MTTRYLLDGKYKLVASTLLAIYCFIFLLPPTPLSFYILYSPTGVEGMKEFLQRDDVDVWRVTPDGLADIRINKNLIQGADIVTKQCTAVADVEALVQQFENMTASVKLHGQAKQEWHEEYVSGYCYLSGCQQFLIPV